MTKLISHGVTVLNFSRKPDLTGMIIPPECFAVFKEKVPVFFDFDDKKRIGWARLSRKGNKLIATIEITSTWETSPEAILETMQRLTPSVGFIVKDAFQNLVTSIDVTMLSLGPGTNQDKRILPLGDKIELTGRSGLH